MSIRFFSGFETGDISEWSNHNSTFTVDTAIVRGGGAYSLEFPWDNGNHYVYYNQFSPQPSSGYLRFGLYTTAAGGATVAWIAEFNHSGATIGAIRLVTDGSGLIYLRLFNNITGTQIGSDYQIQPNNWYTVYLKLVTSATVGVLEMMVNGVVVATGSNLNTGSNTIDALQMANQNVTGTGATGNIWFDDIMVDDAQYPPNGYCIARQGNTTAPTYNSWTKTGGTNIWQVWDSTPFAAGSNASTTGFGNEQTMVVDFTTVGGTGSTGHGTGNVGSWDLINAFKVAGIGKTSSTTSDGTDSIVFRTPAGGGGADTVTGLSGGWTTADTYKEVIISTPTLAQVQSCEVGFSKGTGSNTHTIEDAWAIVDFLPVPYSMFQGSETEPYIPLSYETLVEDSGEEQAWYPSYNDDDAQLILGTQLSILIIDLPGRSFPEVSDTDYYPNIDTDPSSWFNILPIPIPILIMASQWDNSVVPLDMEQLIEDSEGDYYPDFSIDNSWYISFSVIIDPSLIFSESIPDFELLDFNLIRTDTLISGTIPNQLIFSDYNPNDTDQLVDDSSDPDIYVDLSIDLSSFLANPPVPLDPSLVFLDYSTYEPTLDNITLTESYLILLPVNENFIYNDYSPLETETLIEESEGDYYPDFSIDLSFIFSQIVVTIEDFIFNDYSPIDSDELIEDSEGDYYPDFSIDSSWYFAQVFPVLPLNLIFNDYTPTEFDLYIEATEGDYYPSWEEQLQWFIPTTLATVSLFGSFVFPLLGGQVPTIQPTGGVEFFGGGYGGISWTSLAFTGNEGLLVQTNYGGILGWNTQIPTDNYVVTGNELFTLYYTITDNIPNQLELQIYESTNQQWHTVYWASQLTKSIAYRLQPLKFNFPIVDYFGLGGTFKGTIPNVIGFWLSATFTAADLGLVPGNIITGLAWGVYNLDGASSVVFSDTLVVSTAIQFNIASADNQAIDYLDLYTEDLGEGDTYPDFSIDNSWFLSQPLLNLALVFTDYNPLDTDQLIEDFGDEQAWYPPFGNEVENWVLQPIWVLLVFNDYSPLDTDQLIDDDGSEISWYPPFGNEVENWIFIQALSASFVIIDYSPLDTDQLIDDDGSEISWYPPFGNESENWSQLVSIPTNLIFVDYTPSDSDQLIEDEGSDQSWYPPFGNEVENWFQIITATTFVFADYNPIDTEQLIEDDGSEQAWYLPFGNESENWSQIITTTIIIFVDYAPLDSEQLIEDDGSDAWYVPFGNEVENWFQLLPITPYILIAASQWDNQTVDALENYTDDLSDPDIYPDTSIDNTWYFVQVQQMDISLVASIARVDDSGNQIPLSFDLYIEDDGSEPIWYPIEGNIVVILVPADIAYIITASEIYRQATDTPELQIDDLGDEQAWYLPQDELLSWFIPPIAVSYLIFVEYTPTDTEQLIEDLGIEIAWYPPIEDILTPTLFAQPITDAFHITDYNPIDTDQLIEDIGDDQSWYPPKEEDLQWFIPSQINANLVFSDYAPLESEQLIEESEGDYYPDFGVDPSAWSFVLATGVVIIVTSSSAPETPDDYILDLGDEPSWYLITGDILPFFIIVGIGILIGSSQEYSRAIDFLELYSEESEGDYYPAQDDLMSWFFGQQIITTNFIFNDYNPLDSEELTEDSEGDFYPDFSVDPAPWFATIQPNPFLYIATLEWAAIPRELEIVMDDTGDEPLWYSLDITVVLVAGSVIITQLFTPLDTLIKLYFNLVQSSAVNEIILGG